MHRHPTAPFDQLEPRHGVLVLDGYGIKVRVDRGHLLVEDGIGATRRTRRFSRATHGLTRLVLLGHTGYITLEAIRWLSDLRIGLIHLDADGRVLATSAASPTGQPQLRRTQALAPAAPYGLDIARRLLRDKIAGQLDLVCQLDHTAAGEIEHALDRLDQARTLNRLRVIEAEAAVAYWQAWAPIPVSFVRADLARVPEHWRTVGVRSSGIGGRTRSASTPAHATLNYLYALLEAEARLACHTVGLDPTLGILHTDKPWRDSLVFDLIEPARPAVDRYLLDLLARHHFRARDFTETRSGVCRILPPLTHTLAETAPTWTVTLGPVVEGVAQALADSTLQARIPTPLTQANRHAAHGARRRTPRPAAVAPARPIGNCADCGQPASPKGDYCPDCYQRHQTQRFPIFHEQGLDALSQARAEGRDPAHGGQARQKRSASITRRNQETMHWNQEHAAPDPDLFRREILPRLRDQPIRELMAATGLSHPYCAMIRRGAYVPHPRHWDPLRSFSER
jgi:CRISPR-associated endonuclease Cas1